ncbi:MULTISPECIES: anti-phage dCTP deaminase [Acinetobacter]|uniref:Anti-phage dCTP deaminase n=1 Tax=Acinetobacter soli TaxID=487316 RepID=A0A1P8EK58_9GAMM|nr:MULTISPECIES: anti-phage dCTP deaminase [Acinetobacter]APV36606.1 deoxycytidylate deaminase [Acinetobacter soli]ENV58435.1 hypothetical protein F951_00769 [Acinetobacter soli CIP 110264]KQD01634.1 deoxycytidylate deaminase [Acinetobacter soli]MCF3127036.1 deaminase [Acinetobacter soli]MCL9675222.1 deaminase [Acinetobacter sp. ACZLY 512]
MRLLEQIQKVSNELIIGLVGAVGSSLNILTTTLTDLLETEFAYDVEIITVSKDILAQHVDEPAHPLNAFERIYRYMDVGNQLRHDHDTDFLALQIARLIAKHRQAWQAQHPDQDASQRRVAYIIDSLKHEAEIQALRQIYTNGFFQLSLYESKTARHSSLIQHYGISPESARILIERDEGEANAYGQHTSEAFHLADYFLKLDKYNPEQSRQPELELRASCLRFLRILFADPYITPTFNEFATYMSFTASVRSADLSRQVGAVIARNNTILAVGSNDVPKFQGGTYWPYLDDDTGEVRDLESGRDFMRGFDANTIEKNKIIDDLFQQLAEVIDQSVEQERTAPLKLQIQQILKESKIKKITEYGRVVHAEMDALLSCSRSNISTQGATLFVTTFPCHNCAKHIISAGIEKVVFVEPYPKSKALMMHEDSIMQKWEGREAADQPKLIFEPFVGVGARSFVNLFSVSLGIGRKLKRKSKDGYVLQWDGKTAQPRLPMYGQSYHELEQQIEQLLKDQN